MDEWMLKCRLHENMYRINSGKQIALFPYGGVAKQVKKLLHSEWGLTPDYLIDNNSKEEGVIPFSLFAEIADLSNVIVVIAVENFVVNREWLGKFLGVGIKADSIVVMNKCEIPSIEAMERVINMPHAKTLLDVGCGIGLQGRIFHDYGKEVLGLTKSTDEAYGGKYISNLVNADYMEWETDKQFDIVWMSHVLEHVRNVEDFLQKAKKYVKKGGVLAITVPSSEKNILLTHIHYFNAGKLLRYLVGAGFDCRKAEILVYGYNLSIILPEVSYIPEEFDVRISEAEQEGWEEQEKIWQYIPGEIELIPTWQNGEYVFNGEIEELNWRKYENKIRL